MASIRTLVVGLGKAGWEHDLLNGGAARSHSFSILEVDGFELIAGVDLEYDKRIQWGNYFNLPTFPDLSLAIDQMKPDLIVISTPISELFSDLIVCLRESCCKILVEKPVAANKKEVTLLNGFSDVYKGRVLVNLPRLFSREFFEMQELVNNEVLVEISGRYSGTALNTSLHFISLVDFLIPNLTWSKNDEENPEIFKIMNDGNNVGSIEFNGNLNESNFELFIIFERMEIKYLDGGKFIEIQKGGAIFSLDETRSFYQRNVYNYIGLHGFDAAKTISGLSMVQKSITNLFC